MLWNIFSACINKTNKYFGYLTVFFILWVVGWLSVWNKVQTCIWPNWCHCHSLSLASVKSRLVLPFWYRLTWVVLEKRAVKRVCFFIWCNPNFTRISYIWNLGKVKVKWSIAVGRHLTTTGTHVRYGITQYYLLPGRGDIPAFTPAEAGTRLSDPGRMQGWVDLVGWLQSEMLYPPEDGHPSQL